MSDSMMCRLRLFHLFFPSSLHMIYKIVTENQFYFFLDEKVYIQKTFQRNRKKKKMP